MKPIEIKSARTELRTFIFLCLLIALACFAYALYSLANPLPPSGKGISGLVAQVLNGLAGKFGEPLFYSCLGVGALGLARYAWKRLP